MNYLFQRRHLFKIGPIKNVRRKITNSGLKETLYEKLPDNTYITRQYLTTLFFYVQNNNTFSHTRLFIKPTPINK